MRPPRTETRSSINLYRAKPKGAKRDFFVSPKLGAPFDFCSGHALRLCASHLDGLESKNYRKKLTGGS
jgi:hypothetical protein